jgi:hypothetical protein
MWTALKWQQEIINQTWSRCLGTSPRTGGLPAGWSSSPKPVSSADSAAGAGAAGRREWNRFEVGAGGAGSSKSGWLGGGRERSPPDTDRKVNRLPPWNRKLLFKPEVVNVVVQHFTPEVDTGVVFNRNLSLGLFLTGSDYCCTKPEVAIGCCFEPKVVIVVLHNRKLLLFIG